MKGYEPDSYGEGLADVYDEWYGDISDTGATAELLESVAAATGPLRVLELAVGTGRRAIPLAARGHAVTGIDISQAMLDRLAAADAAGLVTAIRGDMVDDLPPGPFDLVFVAYNSLFMLTDAARQAACFAAVADALAPGGRFVVEAFVPDDPPRRSSEVTVRSMTAAAVVLSIAVTDAEQQRVDGQLVELTDGGTVRLRPYSLRYSTPTELDGFAAAAGMNLLARYGDVDRSPFDPAASPRHVSVYGIGNDPVTGG